MFTQAEMVLLLEAVGTLEAQWRDVIENPGTPGLAKYEAILRLLDKVHSLTPRIAKPDDEETEEK